MLDIYKDTTQGLWDISPYGDSITAGDNYIASAHENNSRKLGDISIIKYSRQMYELLLFIISNPSALRHQLDIKSEFILFNAQQIISDIDATFDNLNCWQDNHNA